MVIRDAETFGEPPNRRHTQRRRRKTRVLGTAKKGKGRGGDLRSARQPMRV